jgi:hypothetical protein
MARFRMTQLHLAQKLQEKLGFTRTGAKKRHGSIKLAAPDHLIQRDIVFRFNPAEPNVSDEQYQKLQLETGLDPQLQKDLTHCHLDREVAKLLYYSYRVAQMADDPIEIKLARKYINMAKTNLDRDLSNLASPSPDEFWDDTRRQYKDRAVRLRKRISAPKGLSPDDNETRECLRDFVDYLKSTWGVD